MLEENELYDKALKIANGEIKYKETIPYFHIHINQEAHFLSKG